MAISDTYTGAARRWVLSCSIMILLIAGQTAIVKADNTAQKEFQSILHDSLEDLWTGRNFSPQLKKRQPKLSAMLKTDAVGKAELESMLEQLLKE